MKVGHPFQFSRFAVFSLVSLVLVVCTGLLEVQAITAFFDVPNNESDMPEARLDVYVPAGDEPPYPTIVHLTPPAFNYEIADLVDAQAVHTWDMDALLAPIDASGDLGTQPTFEPITLDNASRVQQLAVLDNESAVYNIAWSPDGETLVSVDTDGRVNLWDVASGGMIAVLEDRTAFVTSVAFSPDGNLVATGSGYGDSPYTVRLLDMATGERLSTLEGFDNPVYSLAFSPDGAILAIGGGDPFGSPGSFQFYDVATGKILAHIEPRHVSADTTVATRGMAFSPEGTLLATANGDGTVRLWDLATVAEQAVLGQFQGWVGSVAFSPDATLLAAGGVRSACGWNMPCPPELGEVRLWDVQSLEMIGILEGQSGGVQKVAFSPDGTLLTFAGGYEDGTVQLWDTEAVARLAVLEHPNISNLAFSLNGLYLASSDWDGTVRLWGVQGR